MHGQMDSQEARDAELQHQEQRWREVLTGSYVIKQVVERDDRILTELLRNVVPIDESHGLVPGATIVAGESEGGVLLAPPGDVHRYTTEPQVYFVERGRVDVLAPGPAGGVAAAAHGFRQRRGRGPGPRQRLPTYFPQLALLVAYSISLRY